MHRRICTLLMFAGCLIPAAVNASDFQDGQAARAVIGQSSFSAFDKGVTPRALSISKGNLYVADASNHVFAFEVSRIGAGANAACPVCLVSPQSSTSQSVFEGVAAAAVFGRNIAIADPKAHRVLIWRGTSPMQKPDVVLTGFSNPLSVALDGRRLFVGDAGSHHVFVWNALPTADDVLPDVTLGDYDASESLGADTLQIPSALASDGSNLYVGDSGAHRVLVFSPADSAMPEATNAATLSPGPLAPGTLVAIDHAVSASATVLLNGNPIRVTDKNGGQLQVQIPYDLNNAAAASLWIRTDLEDGSEAVSRPVAIRFTPASPGIFAFGAKEPRTGMVLHSPDGVPLSPEDPAKPGELLTVWATGLGSVASAPDSDGSFETVLPVEATIGGNPVEVIAASLPADAIGIYEVRLRLPAQLPQGATLVLLQNDSASNAVTFPVQKSSE